MAKEKQKSAIEEIVVDSNTYSNEKIEPTYVNFFFGRNGAGKSTIADTILQGGDALKWRAGRTQNDYNILVYDQRFISKHFSNYEDLAGVFTLNEVNIDIQEKVNQLEKDKEKLKDAIGKKEEEIETKKKARDEAKSESQDREMRLTEGVRKKFDNAMKGKKLKKTFCPAVEEKTPVEHTEDEILELYAVAYDKDARTYSLLKKSNDFPGKYDLSDGYLLSEAIISTSDTQYAKIMHKLGNSDWVKEGHAKYMKKAGGICPFCHGILKDDFEEEIRNCFDETYQESINAVAAFQSAYTSYTDEVLRVLAENLQTDFPRAKLDVYREKLKLLQEIVKANLQLIQKKVEKPASTVELEDIAALISELDKIVEENNVLIQNNNTAYNQKRDTKIKCERILWEHLAFLVKDEIADAKEKDEKILEEIRKLEQEKTQLNNSLISKEAEIRAEQGKTVNTDTAYESMNAMLKDSGFQGFSLRKKKNDSNRYEVVRNGKDPVKKLSEGERNFIAFLYFYHLVKGSGTTDSIAASPDGTITDATDSRDKIVVIDDPVTSMDSGSLFIVSSMVRRMITVCQNNKEILHPDVSGSYIKQIFILTHNAYFHREITYDMVEHYDYVTFFMVRKVDDHSSVSPCIYEAKQISEKDRNINPVQNAYTALWSEYKELKSSIPLLNVIRRILQYYFMELCGYNGSSIRDTILETHKDDFLVKREDGTIDDRELILAMSMLSYIDNDYSFIDGFNLVEESTDPECYRRVFEKIFEKLEQGQHYKMMTNIAD